MRQLWKKWGMFFLSIMLIMAMMTGCQEEPAQNKRKAKAARTEKTLSYSILSPVVDLDPQRLNQMDASTIGYHIYEGLVRNEEGKIVPAGAEKWEISEDGKRYIFNLRQTCWRDGEPVTAEDYVRGIRRLVEKETESDYGFLGYYIKNGAAVHHGALNKNKLGVKALNEQQIEIRLERQSDCFLQILSMVQFSPVPKKALSEAGEQLGTSREYLFENGPFYVEEWNQNGLMLRKNQNYWNAEKVKLDKVVITKKDSIKEAREAYEQGKTNLFTAIYLPEEEETYSLYRDGQLAMIRLNLKNKKLADSDFRKALWYCVDQEELNKQVYNSMHNPATGFVMPELFEEEDGKKNSNYDLEKATQYMEKAKKKLGWKKKKPWKLTLICSEAETRKQAVLYLKEQWEKALGIKVEIKTVTSDERFALEAQGKFDMILTKWVPDYGDPAAYLENWMSNSPYNQGRFKKKAFDKKMKQAEAANGEKRIELLKEAEEILMDEVPAIPLYFRRKILMMKPGVEDLEVHYIGYQYNYIYCDVK